MVINVKTVKAIIKERNITPTLERKAYYPIVFLLSFVASNGQVLGTLSPFTSAIIAALPYGLSITAFFGSMVGYVLFGGMINNLSCFIATILVLTVKFCLQAFSGAISKRGLEATVNCIVCTIAVLGTGLIWTLLINNNTVNIIIAVAQSFMAGSMTYFCWLAFKTVSGKKPIDSYAQISSLLVVLAVLILSLFSIDTGYVNVGRILGVLLTLVLMDARGVTGAVTGGSIAGVCSILYSAEFAAPAGILTLASFFGGVIKPIGKTAQTAMFIVAATAFTVVSGASQVQIYQMLDIFIASVLFTAIPKRATQKLSVLTVGYSEAKKQADSPASVNRAVAAKLQMASGAIDDLSDSVKKVSKQMESVSAQDISTVYTNAADKVCTKCGFRLLCWEDSYNDTMSALNSFTKKLRTSGKVRQEDMPKGLSDRCCKPKELINAVNSYYGVYLDKKRLARNISQSRSIAIEQFEGIADMLCEISGELSDIVKLDPKSAVKAKRVLDEMQISTTQVSAFIDKYSRMSLDVYTPDTLACSAQILADKLSDTLGREFEVPSVVAAGGVTKLSFFEQANYTLDFYTAQSSVSGGTCGDSYEFFVDAKGYAHLILSDGMGSGKRAAVDSVMTCSLILKLIKAGFGLASALKLINASLIVKSDDESLATLDIAKFDLYMGTVSLYKAGAAATFIKKGSEVFCVDSDSLPIGILRNITFDCSTYKLSGGDVVVMVSDGVLSGGEEWLEAEIELSAHRPTEELAARILREAKRRSPEHADDMTVIAARLKKAV